MRVFILPSWCPTINQPLSGVFFVEQAHVMAQLRPEWTVAICKFDLARSRIPWRLNQSPQFLKDFLCTRRLVHTQAKSGLHEYQTWVPYRPGFGYDSKWVANVSGLVLHARLALDDFTKRFGKPDLIHAHAVYPGGAAAVSLGQALGIAVGLTEHLGPFPPAALRQKGGQVMPLVADTYSRASVCSAVSQSLANRIMAMGLVENVNVLANFLPDYFGIHTHNERSSGHGRLRLLSVGGPSYAKGTDILLKALAKTPKNISLDLVGGGPELAAFKKLAAELGLTERICWLGDVPRELMSKHYQHCDAFVLPSRGETFGISFIEALAFGKPLIATSCGGPEEIVNESNGIMVPINDENALAAAIMNMAAQLNRYDPDALRSEFLKKFSGSSMLERIEPWYQTVISAHKT